MGHRTGLVPGAMVLATVLGVAAAAAVPQRRGEPVMLSAVVLDRAGGPVNDLRPHDFRVTENGKPVVVKDVAAVSAETRANGRRSVVLVLGSGGTGPELTSRVQQIARRFMETTGPNDQVSVIRVANPRDEIAGTRQDMSMRIAEYRAPMGEPLHRKTSHDVLDLVARVSRELMDLDAPRRAVVFIGSRFVYDVDEPLDRERDQVWPHWVSALTTAARANVSVYVIDPNGLQESLSASQYGLVAQTGGVAFYNINNFEPAVRRVWRDTGSYYALEYEPAASTREVQDISVKVSRPGVSVRARRSR